MISVVEKRNNLKQQDYLEIRKKSNKVGELKAKVKSSNGQQVTQDTSERDYRRNNNNKNKDR